MKTLSGLFTSSILLVLAIFIVGGCDPSSPEEDPEENVGEKETGEAGETSGDGSELPTACVELSKLCDLCS